ncbi:hypothetical protein BO71DRAFT_87769 [Aspergillus ellipticus CBS 707.79]|uniref:Uncharacterized protein n=1 Tax=Aspergillus ellipticus CBS 707.79 TaxID=1448320 RepID=A0A319DK85_9EURO|nr:hypothetical protein BO71DRAFT_87769 [Aspergillus ellipticus CBS 707.79]
MLAARASRARSWQWQARRLDASPSLSFPDFKISRYLLLFFSSHALSRWCWRCSRCFARFHLSLSGRQRRSEASAAFLFPSVLFRLLIIPPIYSRCSSIYLFSCFAPVLSASDVQIPRLVWMFSLFRESLLLPCCFFLAPSSVFSSSSYSYPERVTQNSSSVTLDGFVLHLHSSASYPQDTCSDGFFTYLVFNVNERLNLNYYILPTT